MIGQDSRWESPLSELLRTRRHLFLRRYGDEVNRQAVAALRSAFETAT